MLETKAKTYLTASTHHPAQQQQRLVADRNYGDPGLHEIARRPRPIPSMINLFDSLPTLTSNAHMTAVLLPSLVLHTSVAFLLQLPTIAAASQTTEPPEQQGCSSPKACGSLNISYPFWLEEPGRPPCGSPSFQLKCNSSGAFLSRSMFQA